MDEKKTIEQRCGFNTERLIIGNWKNLGADPLQEKDFAKKVIDILSPKVTKNLPSGWQNIDSVEKAIKWIKDREQESVFLTIQLSSNKDIVGYVFLYQSASSDKFINLRLGFLISESVWGIGIGSELIKGLVEWCEKEEDIRSIAGGVEKENVASIKVMKRNGFVISQTEHETDDTIFLERKFNHKKY